MRRWMAALLAAILALSGAFALAEEVVRVEADAAEITLAASPAQADDAEPEAAEARIEMNAPAADPAAVKLDKKHFPDSKFRSLVAKRVDTDGNGVLSGDELDLVVVLDVPKKGIKKLKGIQYFKRLEYLYCQKNKLTGLDVSRCRSLRYLDCGDNRLEKLTLGELSALEYLDCGGNRLTGLDVSGCPALAELRCDDNRLSRLNVKQNKALALLDCRDNRLKAVYVRKNKALTVLQCQGNRIASFDIEKLPPELRALTGRENLRGWNDKEHFWRKSDEYCLVLPASTQVTEGEKLLYQKGYYLTHVKVKTKRKQYKRLSDEQYANFRNVATTGMGKNALYRGANPLDTRNGRAKQAMKAVKDAGIRTVINMSDNAKTLKKSKAYKKSYYATAAVWAKQLTSKFNSKAFRKHIPSICRFMIRNEGPYYVHCIWGKDRTGFMCALLECLMGASGKEVVRDYLVTYYNFYGVKLSSSTAEYIGYNRIRLQLAQAFGVASIMDPEVDLSACAEKYLRKCGLSDREIAKLKARLAADY